MDRPRLVQYERLWGDCTLILASIQWRSLQRRGLVAAASMPISGTMALELNKMVMLVQACVSSRPPTTASVPGTMGTELSPGPLLVLLDNASTTGDPYASRSSEAGTFEHSKRVTHDDWDTGATVTRAAKYNQYSKVAGSAVPYDRAGVARCAVWDGEAGTVRQRVSDEPFEPTMCNGRRAGFNTAGVADSAR